MTADGPASRASPPARRLVVMDEARFACQGTGMCCSGYAYGPIEPAVVAAVRAHRFRQNADVIGAADPFPEVPRQDGSGGTMHVLRTVGARCVFLSRADRCLIHEELGPGAKPAICRAYPMQFTEAPDGAWYVSLNMECGGFAEGRRSGPTLREQLPALEGIARLLPAAPRVPAAIPITAGQTVQAARFARLDDAWLAGLRERHEPIAGHLRNLARQLAAFAAGDDAPALGRAHQEGTPLLAPGVKAPLLDAAGALLPALVDWTKEERAAGHELQAQLCTRVAVALGLLLGQSIGPDRALHARAVALAGQPLEGLADAGAHGVFLDHLKNAVFGKHLALASSVMAALGAEALRLAVAGALAQVIAAMTRSPRVQDVHANEGLRMVNRLLRGRLVLAVFSEVPEALEGIAEGLAGACAG